VSNFTFTDAPTIECPSCGEEVTVESEYQPGDKWDCGRCGTTLECHEVERTTSWAWTVADRKHSTAHPMQPLVVDEHGTVRFRENAIVRYLLDNNGKLDLNKLTFVGFSNDEWEQFAQLIGYSVSGFGSLSYVRDETYAQARAECDRLLKVASTLPPAADCGGLETREGEGRGTVPESKGTE
jgi:ribosomal protein S27AE